MQGIVLISPLLKLVMKEFGLKQQDLADLMGVPLDRVKSLTSGKAQNLKREEGESLIKRLHVRGDWLATGEGPMRQSDREMAFHRRIDAVKKASEQAAETGLSGQDAARLSELLYYCETDDLDGIRKVLNPLSADEHALVQHFRACGSHARRNLLDTAALLGSGLVTGTEKDKGTSVTAKVSRSFLGIASASLSGKKDKR